MPEKKEKKEQRRKTWQEQTEQIWSEEKFQIKQGFDKSFDIIDKFLEKKKKDNRDDD